MPKVPFRAGAEPIRHPGRSRTKVRTAGSSRRMFTSGIRSATSPRSARRLVGQFGTGTSPIWGYTGPCRAATCVPESHGSEPIQPQRAIEGHAGPHPAAPSIPAASTLVFRGRRGASVTSTVTSTRRTRTNRSFAAHAALLCRAGAAYNNLSRGQHPEHAARDVASDLGRAHPGAESAAATVDVRVNASFAAFTNAVIAYA